jgi:hypothetical protein
MSHQLPYKGTVASEKYLTNATVKVLKLKVLKLKALYFKVLTLKALKFKVLKFRALKLRALKLRTLRLRTLRLRTLRLRTLRLRTLGQRLCFDEAYITQTPLSNQNTKFYSDSIIKYFKTDALECSFCLLFLTVITQSKTSKH